jgi:hypothetical protein
VISGRGRTGINEHFWIARPHEVRLRELEKKYGEVFAGEPFDAGNDALVNVPTLPFKGDDPGIWEQVIHGYKEAGDTLVEQTVNASAPHDLLIYPIMTLYRHYLELSLKHLYLLTGEELNEPSSPERFRHKLDSLWKEVRTRLPRVPDIGDLRHLEDVVDLVVGSFVEKDRKATTFRYPDEVQGLPVHDRINVVTLKTHIHNAGRELSHCRAWLLELLLG